MNNENQSNQPGVYRDPQTGAVSEVKMGAGADALARMGWERVPGEAEKPKPKVTRLPENL